MRSAPKQWRRAKPVQGLTRVLRDLDLGSWDNWVPLAIIGVFVVLGALFVAGIFQFRLVEGSVDQFAVIYVEVGIGATGGIFAIIVSLSLVAIQFASQEYSHRIMDLYIKSVVFWSMLTVYLFLMIIAILLLTNNSAADSVRGPTLVAVGSILALVLIPPYFIITAAYLKPEFVIAKLLRRVDAEYLTTLEKPLVEGGGRISSRIDPLLPIVEMIERSVDRGDLSTTRAAMEHLHTTYINQAEVLNSLPIERLFLDYLSRIGRKATSAADEEEAAVLAIQLMGAVGARGPGSTIAVDHISAMGSKALKQDAEPVLEQMINSLHEIFGVTTSEEARKNVLNNYSQLVEDLVGAEKGRLLRQLVGHLSAIAEASLKTGDTATATNCLDTLETIGQMSCTKQIINVVSEVSLRFQELGLLAVNTQPELAERIIRSLLRVERMMPSGERDLIATTNFAKGEVERALTNKRRALAAAQRPEAPPKGSLGMPAAPAAVVAPPQAPVVQVNGGKPSTEATGDEEVDGFADLWDEAKDKR